MDRLGEDVSAKLAEEGCGLARAAGLTILGSIANAVVHHADRRVLVVPAVPAA